jgi:hypothetical protein
VPVERPDTCTRSSRADIVARTLFAVATEHAPLRNGDTGIDRRVHVDQEATIAGQRRVLRVGARFRIANQSL